MRPAPLKTALLAFAIACIAWALYAPGLSADFVGDARSKVLISDFIHKPARNLPLLLTGRILARDEMDFNRPGNLLSLMIDAAIWGKNPVGYHLTSITLHAAVCAMLFLLIVRLIPEAGPWPAFLAALAYAVHPLNCEPVSEVSYREDLLVTSAIFVALFLAMEFLRKPGLWRNLGIGAACVLALLFSVSCKENGAAGPVILAGYWLLWRRGDARESRVPWALLIGSAFAVVTGFVIARFALAPVHSAIFTTAAPRLGGSLLGTLAIQPRIWALEFSKIIVPQGLCADYTLEQLHGYPLGISICAVGVVVVAQVWLAVRHRMFAFGALIFWAGLLPVSNLLPMFRPIADRFLYLPMIGLAVMLAQGLAATARRPVLRACAGGVTLTWICAAALLTFMREPVWQDSLALWQDTAFVNPYSEAAANNLGWALFEKNSLSEAAASFERAIQLWHGDPDPLAGLALAEYAAGQPTSADYNYRKAIALDPMYAHPQQLVRALTTEPDIAAKLEVLARRAGAGD